MNEVAPPQSWVVTIGRDGSNLAHFEAKELDHAIKPDFGNPTIKTSLEAVYDTPCYIVSTTLMRRK